MTDRSYRDEPSRTAYGSALSRERASKGDLPKYAFLGGPFTLPLLPFHAILRIGESIWNDNAIRMLLSSCSCINDDRGLAKATNP